MPPFDMLVVIGAGQAGAELAVQAREGGWAGTIALIGDEPHLPYHRPPLSKSGLTQAHDADSLAIKARATYAKAGIELMTGRKVAHVDLARTAVHFHDGPSMRYTRLAFTTGGRARRLPAQDELHSDVENVHTLRTLADAERLRAGLVPGQRLVVIGGGFIGLEVAAAAATHGLHVVLLEAAPRLLSRVTGATVADFITQVHRDAGVDVRTGLTVERLETDASDRRVTTVCCMGGERFEADHVLIGVGLEPDTTLARRAGLPVDDGIAVDACCRTIVPGVVAAGDCTRQHSALYGRSLRLESVPNAVEQARAAAASVNGLERPNTGVPWFWSDQYDIKLKTAGLSQGHDRLVVRGRPASRAFTVFSLPGDRVLAADAVNRPADYMLPKRLIAERRAVDPARLADDAQPLKTLFPSP